MHQLVLSSDKRLDAHAKQLDQHQASLENITGGSTRRSERTFMLLLAAPTWLLAIAAIAATIIAGGYH